MLEDSYYLGVALCGTLNGFTVVCLAFVYTLMHLIMFTLWDWTRRCGRLKTKKEHSRRIKNGQGCIPDECLMNIE